MSNYEKHIWKISDEWEYLFEKMENFQRLHKKWPKSETIRTQLEQINQRLHEMQKRYSRIIERIGEQKERPRTADYLDRVLAHGKLAILFEIEKRDAEIEQQKILLREERLQKTYYQKLSNMSLEAFENALIQTKEDGRKEVLTETSAACELKTHIQESVHGFLELSDLLAHIRDIQLGIIPDETGEKLRDIISKISDLSISIQEAIQKNALLARQ